MAEKKEKGKRGCPDTLIPAQRLRSAGVLGDPLQVRVDAEIDKAIRTLEKRSRWLRRIIEESARLELMDETCLNLVLALDEEVVAAIANHPDASQWLRETIIKAAIADGLIEGQPE